MCDCKYYKEQVKELQKKLTKEQEKSKELEVQRDAFKSIVQIYRSSGHQKY